MFVQPLATRLLIVEMMEAESVSSLNGTFNVACWEKVTIPTLLILPGSFAGLKRFLTKFIAAVLAYDIGVGEPFPILPEQSMISITSTGSGTATPVAFTVTLY